MYVNKGDGISLYTKKIKITIFSWENKDFLLLPADCKCDKI